VGAAGGKQRSPSPSPSPRSTSQASMTSVSWLLVLVPFPWMQVCTRKVTFSLASVARARGRKRPNPEGEGPAEPGEASTAKGGDAMEVDGQGVALEPPQPQAPLLVPVLPSSAPLAQPPAVPSEPAPTEPPPSQHAAAQPMGIVQFCTLLLHRLVGPAVDKSQGKRWAC